MNDFLTVEDVNTANIPIINRLYKIDTSDISLDEFTNVLYDFCIISHEINNETGKHKFTIEIHNSLWKGRYYIDNQSMRVSPEGYILDKITSEDHIVVYLVLNNFSGKQLGRLCLEMPVNDYIVLKKNEIGKSQNVQFYDMGHHMEIIDRTMEINPGINTGYLQMPFFAVVCKTDLVFNLNAELTVGKVNHVPLGVDGDYLPDGDLVDGAELNITVKYHDKIIPVNYDDALDDYCFDLDLTDKISDSSVNLTVMVNESEYVNSSAHKIRLNANYPVADEYTALIGLLSEGAESIQLTNNILLEENVIVPQSLYLKGDDHVIDCSLYSFIVEGVDCKFENISFRNGAPVMIQGHDSEIVIQDCSFDNAIISDECKGSVLSTLNGENINTIINDSIIRNCHHSIYHNGELSIDNITAEYDNYNSDIDIDYASFLTSIEGTVEISNSNFNINYPNLCSENIDLGFTIALISISNETLFNNVLGANLNNHNTLPFFNTNQSRVYCRYYHADINDCVLVSPVKDNNMSVCHTINGEPAVYKNNVKIEREGMD